MMRAWLPALLFFMVLAVRFAEPVLDGDLFWHMAYGQQMIDHHTLIPDQTINSWTPSDGKMIYCAWLAELVLLGIWKIAGLAGIFVLRYAAVIGVVALQFDLARRCGWKRGPLFWLVLLIALVSSYVGTLPKPELFSFFFFNLLVWLLFRAKLAAERGGNPTRWLAVLPVLFLVWANTHGAFILATPLLAAFVIGEIIHVRFGKAGAQLPLKPLLISTALCALATACTPYGFAYPARLIGDHVLHSTARPDAEWNAAYQSIFSPASWLFGFPVLLPVMLVMFGIAAWRRMRKARAVNEWGLLIAFAAYAVLFTIYMRTTFYLPAVFAAGMFHLLRTEPEQDAVAPPSFPRLRILCLGTFLLLAGYTLYSTLLQPQAGSWCGFGIGGTNPVDEAEFLAQQKPSSPRLVNLFNTGGYLLWRLWPQYKVMVDSRSFPYLGWFDDQHRFGTGQDFDAFLEKYPAPVAIIDLSRPEVWRQFLKSPDWRPLFYGRTAAVFQRNYLIGDSSFDSVPLARLLPQIVNGNDAICVFAFAAAIGDYDTAWAVEERCAHFPLNWRLPRKELGQMRNYHSGFRALAAGDFDQALTLFHEGIAATRDNLLITMLEARALTTPDDPQRKVIEEGLHRMAAPR